MTYRREVVASQAVVASNHPLASVVGTELLAARDNAVDAGWRRCLRCRVVEPMTVSRFGAGFFLIRNGRSGNVLLMNNYASVRSAATPTMCEPRARQPRLRDRRQHQ